MNFPFASLSVLYFTHDTLRMRVFNNISASTLSHLRLRSGRDRPRPLHDSAAHNNNSIQFNLMCKICCQNAAGQ